MADPKRLKNGFPQSGPFALGTALGEALSQAFRVAFCMDLLGNCHKRRLEFFGRNFADPVEDLLAA